MATKSPSQGLSDDDLVYLAYRIAIITTGATGGVYVAPSRVAQGGVPGVPGVLDGRVGDAAAPAGWTAGTLPAGAPPQKNKKKAKKKKKKKGDGGDGGDDGGGDGGGADGFGDWKVPKASENDKNWCHTWMSDPNDDGSCFALMYHHCVDGYKDQGRIPAAVRAVKASAMRQVYDVQKDCTHDNDGKVPEYKCFSRPPADWTSVCVARPDLAGKGKCKKVTRDEWRMWVKGEDPQRKSECQFSSLYLKSHFRSGKIQGQYTGKHGRG